MVSFTWVLHYLSYLNLLLQSVFHYLKVNLGTSHDRQGPGLEYACLPVALSHTLVWVDFPLRYSQFASLIPPKAIMQLNFLSFPVLYLHSFQVMCTFGAQWDGYPGLPQNYCSAVKQ